MSIDQIIEVLFDDGGELPEPLRNRMKGMNPAQGQPPQSHDELANPSGDPTDPNLAGPYEKMPHHVRDKLRNKLGMLRGEPDDRTGSVSMSDMIPPGEMATIDQLLDQYFQVQKTQGPEAAKVWFDKYRTAEFESLVNRMVESMLAENVDPLFQVPEHDLPFVQDLANERGISLEQAVRDYLEMYGKQPAGSRPITMKGRRFSGHHRELGVPNYLSNQP